MSKMTNDLRPRFIASEVRADWYAWVNGIASPVIHSRANRLAYLFEAISHNVFW